MPRQNHIDLTEVIAYTTILLLVFTIFIGLPLIAIKSARVNAELWNRCFPESRITASEAFWSDVRIDQCPALSP